MTSNYVETMRDRAIAGLSSLYGELERVTFADFPDYGNVGDSAIALGTLAYFREAHAVVDNVYTYSSIDFTTISESPWPITINGGGNIGGLYPLLEAHRYQLMESVRGRRHVFQAPQSIHFVSDEAREKFARAFNAPGTDLAVRDNSSLETVMDLGVHPVLSPDAVHVLGRISPTVRKDAMVVELIRDDGETAIRDNTDSPFRRLDWITDDFSARWAARIRKRAKYLSLSSRVSSDARQWHDRAQRRLRRGVATLSPATVIVTDRLHAMLIGLQLGRVVIALDNSTGKLSRYANTWFSDLSPDLEFVDSISAARTRASQLMDVLQ